MSDFNKFNKENRLCKVDFPYFFRHTILENAAQSQGTDQIFLQSSLC